MPGKPESKLAITARSATAGGELAPAGSPFASPPRLSDTLALEFLLQETERTGLLALSWTEAAEGGGYAAEVNGVRLRLEEFPRREGRCLCLTLLHREETAHLMETVRRRFFWEERRGERVGELLARLLEAVRGQVRRKRENALRDRERIKQSIYRRMILGD